MVRSTAVQYSDKNKLQIYKKKSNHWAFSLYLHYTVIFISCNTHSARSQGEKRPRDFYYRQKWNLTCKICRFSA